jgi:hypothetical protein
MAHLGEVELHPKLHLLEIEVGDGEDGEPHLHLHQLDRAGPVLG